MKVLIVVKTYPHEGREILGVHLSPEDAAKHREAALRADDSDRYDEVDIEVHELTGSGPNDDTVLGALEYQRARVSELRQENKRLRENVALTIDDLNMRAKGGAVGLTGWIWEKLNAY